jgi:hypothetical protein
MYIGLMIIANFHLIDNHLNMKIIENEILTRVLNNLTNILDFA